MVLKEQVVDISCTLDVALAVGKGGSLFSWRTNTHPTDAEWQPAGANLPAVLLGRAVGSLEEARVPGLVQGSLAGKFVTSASAGRNHSTVVTEEGHVHTFGYSNALGHGEGVFEVPEPRVVEALRDAVIITAASAGDTHSLLLTEGGRVYSCGFGRFGALGHGNKDDVSVPQEIESIADFRVEFITTGTDSSFFLTEYGGVQSCGNNQFGNLGHPQAGAGRHRFCTVPAAVVAPPGVAFTRVVAGRSSRLLIDMTGAAWVCGGVVGTAGGGTLGPWDLEALLAGERAAAVELGAPVLLPGLAGGHGAVVGAAISDVNDDSEVALVLFADGTVVGCGQDRMGHGRAPRGRLPGADIPKVPFVTVKPMVLDSLHR
jgi:alpha-tubulin suppressor-like RCC1 family protein